MTHIGSSLLVAFKRRSISRAFRSERYTTNIWINYLALLLYSNYNLFYLFIVSIYQKFADTAERILMKLTTMKLRVVCVLYFYIIFFLNFKQMFKMRAVFNEDWQFLFIHANDFCDLWFFCKITNCGLYICFISMKKLQWKFQMNHLKYFLAFRYIFFYYTTKLFTSMFFANIAKLL